LLFLFGAPLLAVGTDVSMAVAFLSSFLASKQTNRLRDEEKRIGGWKQFCYEHDNLKNWSLKRRKAAGSEDPVLFFHV
jgi:hypothetical protein